MQTQGSTVELMHFTCSSREGGAIRANLVTTLTKSQPNMYTGNRETEGTSSDSGVSVFARYNQKETIICFTFVQTEFLFPN